MKPILAGAAAVALTLAATGASALTWTFSGTTLADGGIIAGSFDWDGASYSNVAITTSGGSTYGAQSFAVVNTLFSSASVLAVQTDTTPAGEAFLQLIFAAALPASGGDVGLAAGVLSTCGGDGGTANCFYGIAPTVTTTAGSVTTNVAPPPSIPVPAGLPLLLSGVGVIGLSRTRRR